MDYNFEIIDDLISEIEEITNCYDQTNRIENLLKEYFKAYNKTLLELIFKKFKKLSVRK